MLKQLTPFRQGVLIAVGGVILVIQCLNAPFINYDDELHVYGNRLIMRDDVPLSQLFDPQLLHANAIDHYMPLSLVSLRLDRWLFQGWLPRASASGSWAPGVRFISLLYHAGAALFLWSFLSLLGVETLCAFFVALAFSVHPLTCETVCWASERKSALSALFGFAALWAALRFKNSRWWTPLTLAFYAAALISKPNTLGLLPILIALAVFADGRTILPLQAVRERSRPDWLKLAVHCLLLIVLAAAVAKLNLQQDKEKVIAWPGGSLLNTILTDLEILSRYLFNAFIPVSLSVAYCVVPVSSLGDGRIYQFGALLAAVLAVTIWLAPNRRLCVFGWYWILAALGPNLNIVPISWLMQDRFFELSLPGFMLVLAESFSGILLRVRPRNAPELQQRSTIPIVATAYLLMLASLAFARGGVWRSSELLFADAVEKQPASAFARYGLGTEYRELVQEIMQQPNPDRARADDYSKRWIEQWHAGADCPDAALFAFYSIMALNVGEDFNRKGALADAERYWMAAAFPPNRFPNEALSRSLALGYLSSLRLFQKRTQEAYDFARAASKEWATDATRLQLARSALARADEINEPESRARLIAEARKSLKSIPADAKVSAEARALLAKIQE